jgi:hypothetical protein
MFIARSLAFYPGFTDSNSQELSDEIIIPSYHLNKMMERFENDERLYITMTNTNTKQSYLVTIGSPHTYDKNTIFAPQWILDLIGCSGACDSPIKILKAKTDRLQAATKIVIKPLDPVAFEMNTLECFEKAFMNLHSITQDITVPIPIPELGYSMFAHIEKVEPDKTSLIIHGEVNVEFINEFKTDEPEPPNPIVFPVMEPSASAEPLPLAVPSAVPLPSATPILPIQEVTADERRAAIRESWLKRFDT